MLKKITNIGQCRCQCRYFTESYKLVKQSLYMYNKNVQIFAAPPELAASAEIHQFVYGKSVSPAL